jgi:hypothetical protein
MSKKNKKQKKQQVETAVKPNNPLLDLIGLLMITGICYTLFLMATTQATAGDLIKYETTDYLDDIHDAEMTLESLVIPETVEPMLISVCWSAEEQRIVPAYMGCK